MTMQGNKDPWSIAYRVMLDKKKSSVLFSSLEHRGEVILNKQFVLIKMFDELLPDDDELMETAYHFCV